MCHDDKTKRRSISRLPSSLLSVRLSSWATLPHPFISLHPRRVRPLLSSCFQTERPPPGVLQAAWTQLWLRSSAKFGTEKRRSERRERRERGERSGARGAFSAPPGGRKLLARVEMGGRGREPVISTRQGCSERQRFCLFVSLAWSHQIRCPSEDFWEWEGGVLCHKSAVLTDSIFSASKLEFVVIYTRSGSWRPPLVGWRPSRFEWELRERTMFSVLCFTAELSHISFVTSSHVAGPSCRDSKVRSRDICSEKRFYKNIAFD